MRHILLVLVLASSLTTFSQEKNIEKVIDDMANKTWHFITIENDSAKYYANKMINLSKEKNYSFGEILGLEYRGIYKEAVLNDYEASFKDLLLAVEIAEESKQDYLPDLYIAIGILFSKTSDYKKSEIYLNKAVNESNENSRTKSVAIINLATVQSRIEKFEEAYKNFLTFLNEKDLNVYEKTAAYLGIAKNFTRQEKFSEAQEYYEKAIIVDSLKGKKRYAQLYADVIDNAIKMKDVKTIKKYINILNKGFSKVKAVREKLGYYESASNSYKLLNDFEKASIFQDSIIYARDSINNKRYSQDLIDLETKYQTKKKEEQILEEQNKKELWSFISIFVFIILVIVGILLYKNSQKRKQLRANKVELESLLNQRNMLLRETHHRVKNSFQMVSSLLQLQAQGSEAEAAVTALNNAVERVNSMIVLHQQLYAKDNLLGVDLKVYVNDLINEILGSYSNENIKISANISSTILDIDTATSIGLLINELATNSIKHAWKKDEEKKVIHLDISEKDAEIAFKMFDNGNAKKSTKIKQNYGSELIEILIERLNATQQKMKESDFGLALTFAKTNYAA